MASFIEIESYALFFVVEQVPAGRGSASPQEFWCYI
jgi:hypothetical protein